MNGNNKTKPEMSWQDRKRLYFTLETMLKQGPLPRGIWVGLQQDYPVAPRTLSLTWEGLRAKVESYLQANRFPLPIDITNRTVALPDELFHTQKMLLGTLHNQKWCRDELAVAIELIPLNGRQPDLS